MRPAALSSTGWSGASTRRAGASRADGSPGTRQGRNGFGNSSYGGPCPPPGHGAHRYQFTLYALDWSIDLEPGSTIELVCVAIDGRVLETATLMGNYER